MELVRKVLAVMAKSPVVLIIRDGWGVNPGGSQTAEADGNATLLAKTPFHDDLLKQYPKGMISCSGLDVGLPEGQMGNSEVGHLNLGAGRIVYQDLTRINRVVDEGALGENLLRSSRLRGLLWELLARICGVLCDASGGALRIAHGMDLRLLL